MGKIRVLVAVKSHGLLQVIEHLFLNRPELEIVARINDGSCLAQAVTGLLPDLIVANVRLFGLEGRKTLAAIKRSHPGCKLIMVCSVDGFARDVQRYGADACLAEEALVKRLISTARVLSGLSYRN